MMALMVCQLEMSWDTTEHSIAELVHTKYLYGLNAECVL